MIAAGTRFSFDRADKFLGNFGLSFYRTGNIIWSPGYFVSSVGLDEQTIKNYVAHQGALDSGQLRMEL